MLTRLYRLLLSSGIVVTTSIGVATSIAGCKHSKKGVLEGLQQFAKADHALILRWFPEEKRKTSDTDVVTAVRKAILSEDKTGCFNKDNIKKLTLSPEGILADEGESSQIEVQYGTQKQKIYIATEKNPHEVLSLLGTVSKIPFSLPFLKAGITINHPLIEARLRSILAHHILKEDISLSDLRDVHFSYVEDAEQLLPSKSYKILFTYKTYDLKDEARVITVNVQKHAVVSELSKYIENAPLVIPHFSDQKVAWKDGIIEKKIRERLEIKEPSLAGRGYFEPTCLKLSPKEAEHSDLLPGKSLAVSANFMVKGIKKDKGSFTFEFWVKESESPALVTKVTQTLIEQFGKSDHALKVTADFGSETKLPPSKLTDTLRQALRRQEKVSTVKYLTAEVVQSLDFLDKLNKEDKKEDVSLKPGIAVKIPVVYLPGTRLATQVLIYVLANKAKSTS